MVCAGPARAQEAAPDAPADEAAGVPGDEAAPEPEPPEPDAAPASGSRTAGVSDQTSEVSAPEGASPLLQDRRWIELGAFLGGNYLSDEVELGNSFFADQVPGSAFLLGLRGAYRVAGAPAGRGVDPQLSVEVEAKLALSSTEGAAAERRDAFFAPVLGWRAQAVVELLPGRALRPFALAGIGGETVFTSSPFMTSVDTDSALHWGVGVRYDVAPGYALRADVRHGVTAGRTQPLSSTVELHVGLAYRFSLGGGGAAARVEPRAETGEPDRRARPEPELRAPPDADGDGILDDDDLCPAQAEDANGVEDDDGCPEVDADNDGLVGDADRCPGEAEDIDGFDDGDGCPDADNDGDGWPDVVDACPGEAEALNGFEDEDGCGDAVPRPIVAFLGVVAEVQFAGGTARLLGTSSARLDAIARALVEVDSVKIRVLGHTDSQGPRQRNMELSLDRAVAVKQYLVGKGVAAERIQVAGHGAEKPIAPNNTAAGRAANRRIEIELIPGPDPRAAGAAPAANPPPESR